MKLAVWVKFTDSNTDDLKNSLVDCTVNCVWSLAQSHVLRGRHVDMIAATTGRDRGCVFFVIASESLCCSFCQAA